MGIQDIPFSKQFSVRKVRPDTWIINCASESAESPNPHVVIGKERALVIDTTDTPLDVRRFISEYVTDLPLAVASTHSHFDHTLNNAAFSDCPIYMSAQAWAEVQEQRRNGLDKRYGTGRSLGDYTPQLVKPGDEIDLGGRTVLVVDFGGCHSDSSISYLDTEYGILFPGDELESGQVLMQGDDHGSNNTVEHYRDNLLHLKSFGDRIKLVCPPHNGTPIDASIIDDLLENCERILAGHEGDKDIGSLSYLLNPHEPRSPERVQKLRWDPDSRRSEWKGTSIVYSVSKVFNR